MPYKVRPRAGRKSVKKMTRTRKRLDDGVTVFPPTVNINLTTGSAGRTEYPELSWINKKTLENVNVNMTWANAIEAAFGRKIPVWDFYVTKKSRKGMVPPRHVLTTKIRNAIENYKMAMDCYNFCIRKYYGTGDGRSERTATRVAARKSRRAKATTLASAKSKSASLIKNGGIDLNHQDQTQEQCPAIRTAQIVNQGNIASTNFVFPISRGDGGNGVTRKNLPVGIIKQETSDSSGNRQSALNVTRHHSVLSSTSQQSQRQRTPAPSASSEQNTAILNERGLEETEHATGGENEENEMTVEEDDVVSIAESQIDCEEKGIKYEDLRTGFLKRAGTISGAQLLQARVDVQNLKASGIVRGRNKWLDWNIACPAATTLVRDLLDV